MTALLASTVMVLALGGCAHTTPPAVRTVGNADRLINDSRFEKVMECGPEVRGWAHDAVHTINDLEYEARVRGYGGTTR